MSFHRTCKGKRKRCDVSKDSRRKEIIHMLQSDVSLETNRLAALFGVSPVTIRRDFDFLEKKGLVTTIYGGAMVNRTLPDLELTEDEAGQRICERRLIAKEAAKLIKSGDALILDAGGTVKELAIELLETPDALIFTNSILAVNVLAQSDRDMRFITLPGYFKKSTMSFIGVMTLDYLDSIHVEYAFIGVSAFSLQYGGMVPDPEEAIIKRKMSKSAKRTVVLADHWKIGDSSLFTAVSLEDIDILITGKGVREEVKGLRARGIRVIEVDTAGLGKSNDNS